ncbi:MAG TPA: FAD/NAD(P)-binding oxidoreductase [Anaerolineales bacterium]|nr:FAD/NAD(P)-binding oxidoreductase [Anaerolineales bacterium]
MVWTKYLIVGGGLAADAAVEGIRQLDSDARILILAAEADPPYTRPWLSKGLWLGKPYERVWRGTEAKGAELRLRRRAVRLDPARKTVTDDQGEVYEYGSLLLATGGRARRLPFGGENVIHFRTLADYRRLRLLADQGDRFTVIGGGFIGSEIAAALATNGKMVTMVFPQSAIAERVFPRDLAEHVSFYYQEKGVVLRTGSSVLDVQKRGRGVATKIKSASGIEEWIESDGVVAGIGIQPDIELAASAELRCDDGVVVDSLLRTSQHGIFAAGDVASFVNPALGRRIRVEHEDNALAMGKQAGRNMAGAEEPYTHLPYFYSDLFELGYEAVGDLDSKLEVVRDWAEPFQKGVVYYTDGSRVRGVLLWNVWDKVPAARMLIESGESVSPKDLHGRIPPE